MIRSFVAIELDEGLRREISSFVEDLKGRFTNTSPPTVTSPPSGLSCIKWVRPEGLHITIKFLGEVSEDRLIAVKGRLQDIATEMRPFSLRVKGTGTFPLLPLHRRLTSPPRVIWVAIEESKELIDLKRSVDENLKGLGFPEEREFTGHITLARIKDKNCYLRIERLLHELIKNKDRDFGILQVKEIVLMKSELAPDGARYERLAAFRLSKK